jgi:hypothetical protein
LKRARRSAEPIVEVSTRLPGADPPNLYGSRGLASAELKRETRIALMRRVRAESF